MEIGLIILAVAVGLIGVSCIIQGFLIKGLINDVAALKNKTKGTTLPTHSHIVDDVTLNNIVKKVKRPATTKLNEKKVMNIRRLYASGEYTAAELGRKYKCTTENIRNIINRKTWKDLA